MAELSERSEAADRAPDPGRTTTHLLRSIAWWCATVATLVVLDDLTFGPFFWAIARWRGAATAVVAVLAVYVPAQIYLVFRATADHPGRIAAFFLNRLDLERRSHHVARREAQLRGRVVGAAFNDRQALGQRGAQLLSELGAVAHARGDGVAARQALGEQPLAHVAGGAEDEEFHGI